MLEVGLILLETSFSSPTLKVIFLLKTSILEWAVDKNGLLRIKGTSSSSGMSKMIKSIGKINLPILTSIFSATPLGYFMVRSASSMVNLVRLGKGTVSENTLLCCVPDTTYGPRPIRRISEKLALAVEPDLTWSRGFVSLELEAQISLIMFEFSSCLLADSTINLVSDSSRLGLRSGYEEFSLFRCCAYGVWVSSDTPNRELIITRIVKLSPDNAVSSLLIRRPQHEKSRRKLSQRGRMKGSDNEVLEFADMYRNMSQGNWQLRLIDNQRLYWMSKAWKLLGSFIRRFYGG
ncbi:hypothetical protein Tco_0809839 [Tanacetum coccineum]